MSDRLTLQPFTNNNRSMLPTLAPDERVLFDATARLPKRGEVILFHPPLQNVRGPVHPQHLRGQAQAASRSALEAPRSESPIFIKRVFGLPGEAIDVLNGRVFVNEQPLEAPYAPSGIACEGPWCSLELGDGQNYVLGDRHTGSSDSRFWGPVGADAVLGIVRYVLRDGAPIAVGPDDRVKYGHEPIPIRGNRRDQR